MFQAKIKEKEELFDEANEIYEELIDKNSGDSREYLYLAENKLRAKNFESNKRLIETAEQINPQSWLLGIQKLVRAINTDDDIDLSQIDPDKFPENKKHKANYYRLYSILLWRENRDSDADEFLKKSIQLDPHKVIAYILEIDVLSQKILSSEGVDSQLDKVALLQKKIDAISESFQNIGNRNKAAIKLDQIVCFKILNDYKNLEKTSEEIFNLLLQCYFDNGIDNMMSSLLQNISIPESDLRRLKKYLISAKKQPSERLNFALAYQFCLQSKLYTDGLEFFKELKNPEYVNLIEQLLKRNIQGIKVILKKNKEITLFLAQSLREDPDNRRAIIDILVDEFPDLATYKEKILLMADIDAKDKGSALKRIETVGISNFKGMEARLILDVLHEAEAWDLEVISLKDVIVNEKDLKTLINYKLWLFSALVSLKNYKELIDLGEEILTNSQYVSKISDQNTEYILAQTIQSLSKRSVIDETSLIRANSLLEAVTLKKYSLEFLIGVKAELYLLQKNPSKVVDTIIEAAISKKLFSQDEYARLYFLFTRLANQNGLDLISLNVVVDNAFIKFQDDENWVYFGDEEHLDAIRLPKDSQTYKNLLEKQVGNEIKISDTYSSKVTNKKIELIFPLEKYLFWKSVHSFHKLANDNLLNGVVKIETPENEDGIDLQYLLKFMEDQNQNTAPFFDKYQEKRMPLALLSLNEGGTVNAVARIQHEQKGFIHFSSGDISEIELQKKHAAELLESEKALYLDATSALVLSEFGLIDKLFNFYPNIKIPQSVINFLIDTAEKFSNIPGQSGYMGYANGKISFSSIDEKKHEKIRDNFQKSLKILESRPENIEDISLATKQECFSEKELLPESVDACILAQRNNGFILTEDYYYLHLNNFETKKPIPKYLSSFTLVRSMYEKGNVGFIDYLNYFSCLSSYRFRFLHFDTNDMEKALLGDGKIKVLSIDNISKFNFSLTLSEAYGVSFEDSFKVVAVFLCKLIEDDSIPLNTVKQVYSKVIDEFPTKLGKKELGSILAETCKRVISSKRLKMTIKASSNLWEVKISEITAMAETYTPGLWLPK